MQFIPLHIILESLLISNEHLIHYLFAIQSVNPLNSSLKYDDVHDTNVVKKSNFTFLLNYLNLPQ